LGNAASRGVDVVNQIVTGHLLGAAGAIRQCIFSVLAIRDNIAPPTSIWTTRRSKRPSTSCRKPAQAQINVALSNSFRFGGTNASVIMQRVAN